MKAKDVLPLWRSWDSPDIFTVTEGDSTNAGTVREVTGLELVSGPLSEREIVCFGSYGKQPDGTWRHYAVVKPAAPEITEGGPSV